MKVCLVPFPVVLDSSDINDQKRLYPYLPLGLLTLSTLLEQADHEVTLLDFVWKNSSSPSENFILPNPWDVAHLIQSKAPDLVGFSTIFSSYPLVIRWAELFHQLAPETPILFGGPQATTSDEQTLKAFPWIDMVLRGEAENSIVPLITCIQSKSDLTSVPGLTWRNGDLVQRNTDSPIVEDLDNLPIPAYHLYPMRELSHYYNARKGLFHHNFPVEAGRGCPFNCTFCSTSSFFQRRYRAKSVDRIINEMGNLHTQYGAERFDLSHDLFTCNSNYILDFCHQLRERGLHKTISWECYSRTDTVDQKILAEMAAAGCSGLFYGIETGSQRMQRLIGKNLSVKQAKLVVKETLSQGMNASISLICGFPQERQEDLSATFNLAIGLINMGVEQLDLLPLFPLLSSDLYQTYRDTLRYDGPWSSDILYGCLNQDDEALVIKWPNIFAGFYHYDTPGLNHDMVRALLRVINRYPRLLAILSEQNVNVMSVFERWPRWYNTHITTISKHYYLEKRFFSDFFRFLQETLNDYSLLTPQLEDIIKYHAVIYRVTLASGDTQIIWDRFNSDIIDLKSYIMDRKQLTEEELKPATYLFWEKHGKIFSKRITPALAKLLEISRE